MQYKCNICNKLYNSYQGLWNHNKKYHITDISNDLTIKKYNCRYCNNEYINRQSKYNHEQKCQIKFQKQQNEAIYKQEIIKLTNKIELLEKKIKPNKKIINIGTINTNCNNINNTLNICNIGDESINDLTRSEMKYIMSQGLNSIISLVDQLNFNNRLPQNHSFCTTAINDKHVNVYDRDSNSIIKKAKTDIYDIILFNHVNKLKDIGNKYGSIEFNNILQKLISFIFLDKSKKEFRKQLNMLSYNKKDIILATWEKLVEDNVISGEDFTNQIEMKVKELNALPDSDYNIIDEIQELLIDIQNNSYLFK